ncbi:hypothetical protein TNCV_3441831 [Trichonephila clavipes]|nr:hypothetical protein TNCV_3441831 [Trichonephila clavipes]
MPARSPDLNQIENVWDALGRQVSGRNYPPTNKNTLIRALTEQWDKLPQQLLDNVVQNEYQFLAQYFDGRMRVYRLQGDRSSPACTRYLHRDPASFVMVMASIGDEAHFWWNGYVNKQNCRIWSEANPQVYVETPLHPEKLTVWCTLWVGGILLQERCRPQRYSQW